MRRYSEILGRNAVLILLALMVSGETRGAPGVTITVPGEHVSTNRNRISIVGFTDAQSLRLYLNGEFQFLVAVQDSVFHTKVRLPYGLNDIEVFAVTSQATNSILNGDSVQILCGPQVSKEQERLFSEYQFHGHESPEACLSCHIQAREGEGDGANSKRCYPCHNTVRQRLQDHIVDDVRPCTGCHQIERNLTAKIAMTPVEKNPCYQCHQDKIGLFAKDFVHGPVAGGSCTTCHDPHGSEFAKTLVNPVPALCQTCHTEITGQKRSVQHYPFAQGWCVDCHDPHATSNKWILLKEGESLCFKCHFNDGTEKTHRHPYGVKPKHKLAVSLPLGKDGKLECLSCHEPHAANASRLLRSERTNICLGCHPDFE